MTTEQTIKISFQDMIRDIFESEISFDEVKSLVAKTQQVAGTEVASVTGEVIFAPDQGISYRDEDGNDVEHSAQFSLMLEGGHVVHLGGLKYAAVIPFEMTDQPPVEA